MKKRSKLHLGIAIAALVVASVLYYVWYAHVADESARVGTVMEQIATKTQDTARLAQAKSELAALADDERSVGSRFVATGSIVPFLATLEAEGRRLGASVEVISVVADKEPPTGHLSLSITITGPFDSVVRTLGVLENAANDTTLQSLALDTAVTSDPAGTPVWTAATVLVVGIRPDTQADTAPAPVPTVPTPPTLPAVTASGTASTTVPLQP